MVTTKLNLSMTEPQVRQIYAKQGDTGRVLDITLDQTPEDGTLRILRPDGVEVTSEAVTGGEVESGSTFESLTEADVTELTVGIEPVQDLNGYDKPWVGGAGVNLLDPSKVTPRSGGTYGLTVTYSNDVVRIQGTPTSQSASLTFNFITYADDSLSGKGYVVQAFNVTGTPIKNLYGFRNATEQVCAIMFDSAANPTIDCSFKLSVASTSQTAWQPYSNICPITGHDEVTAYFGAEQGTAEETYTTSLGQTVYGGTLDMVSGVLTVDRAMVTLDETIADGGWLRSSLYQGGYYMRWETMGYWVGVTFQTGSNGYIRCSHAKLALTLQEYTLGTILSDGSCNIRIMSPSSTLAEWIQYIKDQYNAGTPIQVIQRLATPQTIQLTPQQIKTLVGTNNVWASSGDIVNITFTYGGLLSELPSEATEIVGKCYCDVEQNGVSSMPFTLNVKKNERES